MIRQTLTLAALATVAMATGAQARDQIRIVGSSTVFPFSTLAAENFAKTSGMKAPVVESTGTGGGIKLFCGGTGDQHPDIANASRKIKDGEIKACADAGVKQITEVKIGFDGIAVANSKKGPDFKITLEQLFLALAKDVPQGGKLVPNPFTKWKDIDAALPDEEILVYGPPPTSGTRDAFVEIAMEGGCKKLKDAEPLGLKEKACHKIREDGAWVDAGENDNLIVQKLDANPQSVGIFGFSFLEENADKVKGAVIGSAEPTFENIASGKYPVSRSLYFYVKNAHAGVVPGIKEFVVEFTSEKAVGDDGYLSQKGLIPLPKEEREKIRKAASALTPMS